MTEPKSFEALADEWVINAQTSIGDWHVCATQLRARIAARPASDLERRWRGLAALSAWNVTVPSALLLEGANALAALEHDCNVNAEQSDMRLRELATKNARIVDLERKLASSELHVKQIQSYWKDTISDKNAADARLAAVVRVVDTYTSVDENWKYAIVKALAAPALEAKP